MEDNLQETINELLAAQPKIKQVSAFFTRTEGQYACVLFEDRKKREHDILVSLEDIHFLFNKIHIIQSDGGLFYVRLIAPDGSREYLHRLIGLPESGYVVHHMSDGGKFTLDNRRGMLMLLPKSDHSSFHRKLALSQKEIK